MSEKPPKPRVARASVVKKISDPLQESGEAKASDEQKSDADGATTENTAVPLRHSGAKPAAAKSTAAKPADESVLAPVKRLRTRAIIPAKLAEEPIAPAPAGPNASSPDAPILATPAPSITPPAAQKPPTVPVIAPAQPTALQPTPALAPQSQPGSPPVTMDELLLPLQTQIRPVEVTTLYNLSAVFVAGAVILLPLVYLTLVGLTLVLSIWWTASGLTLLSSAPGFFFFARFLPSLFGLVFVFFMIKPMLAPPDNKSVTFSLDREHEPALFQFVDHVAAAVGAPPPKRIDVDTEPNASAGFRRGLASLFAGDDLVLSIGLPLAAAMNIRELTGVLAHEFGHFTQGSAMRLHFLIRTINFWFVQVVMERDAWDARLDYWIDVLPGRLAIIPLLFKGCVGASRFLLGVLLHIAAFLSGHLSRQMEFDADRHQLRLCGTESFIQCEYELLFLGKAQILAFHDLQASWTEHRLSDDWPALIVANIDWIRRKPEMISEIRKEVEESSTSWFDTHPASSQRIAMARSEVEPGAFQVQAPANVLFRDFTGLCKAVSLDFYSELISDKVDASNLVPAEQLYQEQTANVEASDTLRRFFQGKVLGRHEIFLPADAHMATPNFPAGVKGLRAYREHMLLGLEQLAAAVQRFSDADDRVRQLTTAVVLFDCDFRVDPSHFNLRTFDRPVILSAKDQATHVRTTELAKLEEKLQDARNRLILALRLLHNSEMTSRIEGIEELRQRTAIYLQSLSALEKTWPLFLRLREAVWMLGDLFELWESGGKSLIDQINRIAKVCNASLQQILQALSTTRYPFTHAKGEISVAVFLLDEMPKADDPLEILQASLRTVDRLIMLYIRLLSQLAVAAESVESAIGLELLPTPKEEEELSEGERAALGL